MSPRKRKGKRNYKAEYKARVERALKRGYSRAVARGHAPKGKAGIKAAAYLSQISDREVRPGDDLDAIIAKDARHAFGRKPKRLPKGKGDIDAPTYQLRLEELIKRDDGIFDWASEAAFVATMKALGLTEREAYTKWFSP